MLIGPHVDNAIDDARAPIEVCLAKPLRIVGSPIETGGIFPQVPELLVMVQFPILGLEKKSPYIPPPPFAAVFDAITQLLITGDAPLPQYIPPPSPSDIFPEIIQLLICALESSQRIPPPDFATLLKGNISDRRAMGSLGVPAPEAESLSDEGPRFVIGSGSFRTTILRRFRRRHPRRAIPLTNANRPNARKRGMPV